MYKQSPQEGYRLLGDHDNKGTSGLEVPLLRKMVFAKSESSEIAPLQ
jgi:hypothetical protein